MDVKESFAKHQKKKKKTSLHVEKLFQVWNRTNGGKNPPFLMV